MKLKPETKSENVFGTFVLAFFTFTMLFTALRQTQPPLGGIWVVVIMSVIGLTVWLVEKEK